MKRPVTSLIWLLWMLIAASLHAQDPHISLYRETPVYFNPAETGLFEGGFRAAGAFRNQWLSLGTPYRTRLATADFSSQSLGVGAFVLSSQAGESGLTHMHVMTSVAYHKHFGSHSLSVGLQGGFIQKQFDPARFSFDSQYDPKLAGYDPDQPTREVFPVTRIMVGDVGAGFAYTLRPAAISRLRQLRFDAAISHLNRPAFSFQTNPPDGSVRMPAKWVLGAEASFLHGSRSTLHPSFMWMNQGAAKERNVGLRIEYQADPEVFLHAAMNLRIGDAMIPSIGVRFNQMFIGLAYDISTSGLATYNRGKGSYEITLSYQPVPKRTPLPNLPQRSEVLDRDPDNDGIMGSRDKCPDIPGSKALGGCPDSDLDGITDPKDACPTLFGPASNQGCPLLDRDGDNVLNEFDLCPDIPGLAAFRGCPDTDGDGLPDNLDRCPQHPGLKEQRGCPSSDIDADGDGTPDKIDVCPTIPGLATLFGCPDMDGDGFSDFEDPCPMLAGPNQGCPSSLPDIDGDGIPNHEDACPYVAGVAETRGCPPIIVKTEVTGVTLREFGPVEFDTDQAIIKVQYGLMLEELAIYLRENPALRLYIQGHTDNEGDLTYNMMLGQNRAIAVMKFLGERGIASSRMFSVSYGEHLPKSSNQTEEGKSKNRRVELILTP